MNDNRQSSLDDPVRDAINGAQEFTDPLDDLVQKTANDPGAPFAPEILAKLAELRKEHRAEFEKLRAQLKKAGCRITELDKAISAESGDTGGQGSTQADFLIDLAQSALLFHTADTTGYADLTVNGHRETWSIRSKGFRRWLVRSYFEATQGAPSSEALKSALDVIEAKAQFDSPERVIHIRVGELDGKLYLDLTDEAWRAVEIDSSGWRVVSDPPVRFRRTAGMQPLPVPEKGGSIEILRFFLNVKSDADFVLVVAWALAVLRNRGPYPILVLSGEQGSAKSTFCSILRSLLDPNTAPLRALPREERDLFIGANNGHVLTFDNVSGLQGWISDALCRLATGGGFAVRQLYSDQDEVLFDAARPVILNGIEEIVTRPDLAERAVFLTLEAISEKDRRPEAQLWAEFESQRSLILGVLLDAVVEGIKQLPGTHLERLPRMADFALWATACEPALWTPGTFWSAYCGNRDEAVNSVIEADLVAVAICAMVPAQTDWTGTATDLLAELGKKIGEVGTKARSWPKSPNGLSKQLRRLATFLRKIGIGISYTRKNHEGTRTITISNFGSGPEIEGLQPSASSASSTINENRSAGKGLESNQLLTVDDHADDSDQYTKSIVSGNLLKNNGADGADDADADMPYPSKPKKPDSDGWSTRL
jgi:hypothetical protein